MSNNWLFTVKDLELDQKSWNASEIFQNRIIAKCWGVNDKNPHFRQLNKADKVIFYLTSEMAHIIIGKAVLSSNPIFISSEDKKKLVPFDPNYTHIVELDAIEVFEPPRDLDLFIEDLSFIVNKEKWGIYFLGGIVKLSDNDYELLQGNRGELN
jgi:predicted RNA-binding protein